jgi:hypothetical protein
MIIKIYEETDGPCDERAEISFRYNSSDAPGPSTLTSEYHNLKLLTVLAKSIIVVTKNSISKILKGNLSKQSELLRSPLRSGRGFRNLRNK